VPLHDMTHRALDRYVAWRANVAGVATSVFLAERGTRQRTVAESEHRKACGTLFTHFLDSPAGSAFTRPQAGRNRAFMSRVGPLCAPELVGTRDRILSLVHTMRSFDARHTHFLCGRVLCRSSRQQ
jgi:hypothetical protein